jgi:hypothetical protein
MENRRESLVAFVLFIALLVFCILMGLVPLLAGTTARADSISFEQFYQASLDTSAGNTSFNFVVKKLVTTAASSGRRPRVKHRNNQQQKMNKELLP